MGLRAEGKTRLDFAGARLTLDGSTKFSLAGASLSLADGGLSAEVPAGSKFSLLLGTSTVVPQAQAGRVLLVAKEDRVVVEEGSARSGDLVLGEGEEFELRRGQLAARKGRTLPPAARPRESVTWRLDVANPNATRGKLPEGRLAGRVLVSTPQDNEYYHGSLRYFAGGEAVTFTVKPTTAVRFRYLMKEPAALRFSLRNRTKDENFGIDLEPVAGRWTTATLFVADIPVNTGGKKVACEAGDTYGWFGWSVGKPGRPAEIQIDLFEVVEIER
jgi:hypothetical protein